MKSKNRLGALKRLSTCECIFSRMDLSDHDRVLVTSSLLQERALDWYELLIAEIDESTLS